MKYLGRICSTPRAVMISVAAITLALVHSACGQQGPSGPGLIGVPVNRRLPAEFKSLKPESGSGEVLLAHLPGDSAQRALTEALNALASYFDQRPQVVTAIASDDNGDIQASVSGSLGSQPVRGMAFSQRLQNESLVAILYDRADQFQHSFPGLSRELIQVLPKPKDVPLQRRPLPDGSGYIALPLGWNLNATNAMVSAEGPEGSADLGINAQVYTPEFAASALVRPPLVASYGDPARALQEIFLQQGLTSSTQSIRVLERTQLPWWTNGVGEALHLEGEIGGEQRESVAIVLMSPVGYGSYMFYYSAVGSTRAGFAKNLPVLLKIWASWKTDDSVFQERLTQAMNNMQACSRIIREVNAGRQDAMERSCLAWDHHIRDTWPFEDRQTSVRGVHNETADESVRDFVRKRNESEGYDRYRVVPYEELNR